MDHLDAEGEAFLSVVGGRDAPPPGANAVRDLPTAEVYRFPVSRVIRAAPGVRGEQVAVIHRGEMILFDDPAEMYASARENDPLAQARLQEIADLQATAQRLVAAAKADRLAAGVAKTHAERFLRRVGLAAIAAALLAGVCVLGAL